MTEFGEYLVATEPGRRERAQNWRTAIGLQAVDGLTTSDYLRETARRNIEGEITADEARRLVDEYYETRAGHDTPEDEREADMVSARINQLIRSPTFRLEPEFYLALHGFIFDGVFSHAGQRRTVNITKREWVLNGDTVQYELESMIEETLAYDFDQEARFKYKGLNEDRFVEHFAKFVADIWQIHPFREGNTRTTALFAIKYLRSKGFAVENDLFARKSFYFRNALVRANYANLSLGVERTTLPLEEFFKVLLYDADIELRNRFLRIGQEYGTSAAEAIGGLHRSNDGVNEPNDGVNVGINSGDDGVKYSLTENEEKAVMAILQDNRITAARLAGMLDVKKRQAERIMASLKKKAGLHRVGSDKSGKWVFGKGETDKGAE